MPSYLDILKRYWGYDAFRPLQNDIIESIGLRKDTLGLMPTGGGKSLTFQVPTMVTEGVCIVVTPLIALMKDQVENLRKRQISAVAIYSGLSSDQIQLALDNAIYGMYKFLYVSPERLSTDLFLKKVVQINVCLIAVDESHCISQWGYDFRPSYLRIADIRTLLPDVPVLALTATATPGVVDDIQEKLKFREKNVFRKSFRRDNLAYVVRYTENKDEKLLNILQKVQGTSVVYVRNRKKTKEVAGFLQANGIRAEHFHAGLSNEQKDEVQLRWKQNQTRVIVATNAFGMGIDKAEVRSVVHLDLPDSLEAYFQEAGRAGRDEKKAFAALLFNKSDATKIKKRISDSFPEKDFIRKVYDALGNYFQIGEGSGLEKVFPFDIADFCARFHLPVIMTHSALKILQQAGYIELSEEQENASRVLFVANRDELYKVKFTEQQDKLIHVLLRSYTGLFTDPAYINEDTLAKRLQWKRTDVYQELVALAKEGVIQYIPRKQTPFITYTLERQMINRVVLGKEAYDDRRKRFETRVKSVLAYAEEENICRSKILLAYFGEKDVEPCGQCDICLRNKENAVSNTDFEIIRKSIEEQLQIEPQTVHALVKQTNQKEQKILQVVRFLLDNGQVEQDEMLRLRLKSS